jgi:O-antigen/teichoic acid export membrane protein
VAEIKLGKNLLAGLTNTAWTAIINLAVVPFYLKYLGVEAYGLIGFFSVMQALLLFLDIGLAQTINREVARMSASGTMREASNLLHTLAVIYGIMAATVAVLIASLASPIANHWLQSSRINPDTLMQAVMLMGLVIACRWPIGLYQGALLGMQRMIMSSNINIVMVTIANLGAVAVLAFVSSAIEAFFAWQAGAALLHVATIRWAAWRAIGIEGARKFDFNELRRIWRFSVAIGGISISAVVLTYLDKILLSKLLSLEEFGLYMLATLVTSGLNVFVMPVFNVIYPRFSGLVVNGHTEQIVALYRLGSRTGDLKIATTVAPALALLGLASALHGMMFFPFALQLAYGETKLPIIINSILVIILVPLIIFFASSFGMIGGACARLLWSVLYLIIGVWITHRHLLKGLGVEWVFQDVGIPFLLTSLLGLAAFYTPNRAAFSPIENLIFGSVLALVALVLSLLLSRKSRQVILNFFRFR